MTDNIEAKIEKLLRMAAGNANENESATALQLAQKLADVHNLDIGTIGKTGAREDKTVNKGLYQYQRTLYEGLAELNHCRYWLEMGIKRGQSYSIRLIGSKINVAVVRNMADYLESAVNAMVKDRFGSNKYFSKDANAFRTGMVDTLVRRIRDKRREEERERKAARREQEARARHPGAATENAIALISDVSREEERANYNYLNGEGAWEAREAAVEASRKWYKEYEEEQRQWALENPEAAAAKKAELKREKEAYAKRMERNEKNRERARQHRIDEFGYDPQTIRRRTTIYDNNEYWAGRESGNGVNLDDQIGRENRKAIK